MALKEPYSRGPGWIVSALGLVAALLLVEAIARIEGPRVCADAIDELLQADPEVGWTFTPGLTVTLEDCDGAGWSAPLSINAEGLADQAWPHEKRPGDVRVLLLGNHMADGLGVAREDRLSVRVAHLADAARGARVSVVNAAIPGYATAEQLRWLEKRGLRYSPDVVVLVLDPQRDLASNLHPEPPSFAAANVAPASGLLAISGVARWFAGRPSVQSQVGVGIPRPPELRGSGQRRQALEETAKLVRALAAQAGRAGASTSCIAVSRTTNSL